MTILSMATFAQTFTDAGFAAETIAQVTRFNTVGFAFAPDGRIFTWEKPGVVRIIKNGVLLSTPFIDLRARVNQAGDRGLLGLALDPNFASNGFVYLLYVHETTGNSSDLSPKTARLTRIKADAANPDRAQADSEVVLLGKISTAPCSSSPVGADCMGSDSTAHTIGTVRFGADGKIYVGMGDGSAFSFADERAFRTQDLNYYNGKILRLNPDGTAPSDNPFYDGNPNSVRSKVYAYGLRNPFRFTNKPGSSEVYIGDVGAAKFEEINRGRGANFGWPCYEGNDPQFTFTNAFPQRCAQIPASSVTKPLYSYPWNGGASIVVGPFYTGTKYPTQFRNNLFFADFVQGFIRRAVFDASNNLTSVESFATGVESPVHLEQGPDGFLYYLAIVSGELKRIRFSGSAPLATATATRPSVSNPYTIAFSSAGSTDPNGGALTYLWDFGDGTTSTSANPTHTYSATGVRTFTAKLTVTNAQGLTGSDTIDVVVGGRPPVATITAPANNTRIPIGTRVTFTGTASDADETLPTSALKWTVLLHHNEHIHPGVTATGTSGSFVVEDHGETSDTYFYEIVLTVTDSAGLTDTKRVNVLPERSSPPPTTLPAPWQAQSVGAVGQAGSASYANGTFTLRGSGADIGGFNDSFYFVYQKLSGDGEIKARVASVQNTAPGAKAGVMLRTSLADNSAHSLMSISSAEGVAFERRDETGFGTALVSGGGSVPPRWVRLVRRGNQISGYQSADGSAWTLVSTATINFPTDLFVGLALTAANNAALCTAVLDNVSVTKLTTNQSPTVAMTAPLNGATFTAPASIRLIANASDGDGFISKVEFFQGSTLINTQTVFPYDFTWRNVPSGSYTVTARAFDNKGAVTTSAPLVITVKAPSVVTGTGTGLLGEYFKKGDYKDRELKDLKSTRIDPTVNFFWGEDRPFGGLDKDHFAVRWRGQVQPRYSGNYTFHVRTSGGVRLWVNNKLLFDDQADKDEVMDKSGTIALTAGQKYSIVLEFYKYDKNKKNTQIRLDWSSTQQPREVIPKSQLYAASRSGDDDDDDDD
jgi:glucose/arabinose dehydrogenase